MRDNNILIVSFLNNRELEIGAFDHLSNLLKVSSQTLQTIYKSDNSDFDTNFIWQDFIIYKPYILVKVLTDFLKELENLKLNIMLKNIDWVCILDNNFFDNYLQSYSDIKSKPKIIENNLSQSQVIKNKIYTCNCKYSLFIQILTIAKLTKLNLKCLTSALAAHSNYLNYLKKHIDNTLNFDLNLTSIETASTSIIEALKTLINIKYNNSADLKDFVPTQINLRAGFYVN